MNLFSSNFLNLFFYQFRISVLYEAKLNLSNIITNQLINGILENMEDVWLQYVEEAEICLENIKHGMV